MVLVFVRFHALNVNRDNRSNTENNKRLRYPLDLSPLKHSNEFCFFFLNFSPLFDCNKARQFSA